jgi:CheY-like chemotaxis protein
LHSNRVLIADENAKSRELLRILLEHQGCEVLEASDGLQAVKMARAMLPDLVLLDLKLPRLNGYAAMRTMRSYAQLKNRSIMALAEGRPGSDGGLLRDAGFTGYITKPVVLRELSGQIARLLTPCVVG